MKGLLWFNVAICTVFGYVSLEDAFGTAQNLKPNSWRKNQIQPRSYYEVRRPDNCVFPLEVLIVQDSTASFEDDRAQMRAVQLGEMFEALNESHPGSKYGLVSFRDKPFQPYGGAGDYCQKLVNPLTSNQDEIYTAYDTLVASGGLDPPESQFHALIAGLQASDVGWEEDSNATRLIVLSTDAQPHFNLDGDNVKGLPPYSGQYEPGPSENGVELQCREQYYPSPAQVIGALKQKSAYLALLVFDGNWQNGLVRRSWDWFNRALGQTEEFLQPLADDSSNFWKILANTINAVEQEECAPATTATPATSTESQTPPLVTPVGSTQVIATTLGSTMEAATPAPGCPCPEAPSCDCPEVIIKIMKRPQELHLNVKNFESD